MTSHSLVHGVDVSVVLPFQDHEDTLGSVCRELASFMRLHEVSFEILALDQGSGDNSQSILSLLHREIPELRVSSGEGSHNAKAAVLVFAKVESIGSNLNDVFATALAKVLAQSVSMHLVHENLLVCRLQDCKNLVLRYEQRERRRFRYRGLWRGAKHKLWGSLQEQSLTRTSKRPSLFSRCVWLPKASLKSEQTLWLQGRLVGLQVEAAKELSAQKQGVVARFRANFHQKHSPWRVFKVRL